MLEISNTFLIMQILLVTTHSLATNPRLVKEIIYFLNNSHTVTVVCFEFENESKPFNDELLKKFPTVRFHLLKAGRESMYPWIKNTLAQKISAMMLPLFATDPKYISLSTFKNSYQINKALNTLGGKFDWIIAHNPGSFWACSEYAKKHQCKFGVDMEDYHPGETTDHAKAKLLKTYLAKTLKNANYISAASPLIMEHTMADMAGYTGQSTVILNSFPQKEFQAPICNKQEKISLVWFSQHINYGRGIEQIASVLNKMDDRFEVHLYGKMHEDFFNKHLKDIKNLFCHGVVSQQELHIELCLFDVGLALEDINADLNRQLCITNKLLAYSQAGIFILASDTPAQQQFLQQHSSCGITTTLQPADIEEKLNYIYEHIAEIRSNKVNCFETAKHLAWENESLKLRAVIS